LPDAQFKGELSEALGEVFRHKQSYLAQPARSQGRRRRPALAHQRLPLSIARTAKAAQSSSGAKQTAIAASVDTEAAGSVGKSPPSASDRASENTH
jgi:hypothetical protein